MVMNEINDLLELKVLLSDTISIFYNDKTYPITKVKVNAYNIQLIAKVDDTPMKGKEIIDTIYDIFSQFINSNRFDSLDLIINQDSVILFNKQYGSKEILTIKSNENIDIRKYITILYNK